MPEMTPMIELLAKDVQAARDRADAAMERANEAFASVSEERKAREASITRIHDRLDEVVSKVGSVYQVLLIAMIPIASGLLLAIIGYMLKR